MDLSKLMRESTQNLQEALAALSPAALTYIKPAGARPALAIYPVAPYYKTCSKPGKQPLTKNGFNDATTDAATVEAWWKGQKKGDPYANIGAPTGVVNGIVVIDVDIHLDKNPPEDGRERLAELQKELGALPNTWTATTGSGGKHYYFKYPAGREIGCATGKTNATLGAGLDIRGEGGCIILPPSLHANTTGNGNIHAYKWDTLPGETPLADLPPAWIDFLADAVPTGGRASTPPKTSSAGAPILMTSKYRLPDSIGDGERNTQLFRYACSLRAYGNEQDAILEALKTVNKERCTPPLSDSELMSIARSAAKKNAGFSPEYQKRREEEVAKPDNLDFSDVGNANAFIRINRDDLLYTASRGWHVWTGTRYQQGDHLAMGRAIDYTDMMLKEALKEYRDATTAGDENAAKSAQAYLKYAKASRRVRNIKSMLEAAQVHYHVEASSLDSNPFILNTPWGMVDLHTGNYLVHNRAERCTLSTPDHKYPSVEDEQAAGGAQLWRDFLILVTNGDTEYMNYLQVVIGSSLIGKPLVEGLYIVYGGGRNGKSTFFKALQLALGDDYTGNINADVFTAGYNRDRENAMTPLIGKRLVCCGELEEGTTLSTSTTKRIASTDDLVVRRLYADRETVKPTHHVFLFTNHLPKVNTTDHGTWRRIHILPFDATMPEGDKDIPDYGSYLAEEAGETILQWCIDGAVKFVQAGCHLPPCTAVDMASTAYQADEDTTAQFLADRIEITGNPNDKIASKDLFNAINDYATDNSKRGKTFSVINKELENQGLESRAESRRVYWIGIKWKPQQ